MVSLSNLIDNTVKESGLIFCQYLPLSEDKKRPLNDLQKAAVEFGEFLQRRLQ